MKLTQDILEHIRRAKAEMDASSEDWLEKSSAYNRWLRAYAMDLCDLAEDGLAWRAEVEALRRLEQTDSIPSRDMVS